MTTYVVSFYKRVPREGDEAVGSFVIEAEGAIHAQWIAGKKPAVKLLKQPYVVASPRHPKKAEPS